MVFLRTGIIWLVSFLLLCLVGCGKTGTLAELQQGLESGIDVNAAGENGMNALMIALKAKDLEKMQLLLARGADPELTDDYNATALDYAVSEDFAAGVQELLARGVDRGYHPKYPLKKIDIGEDIFDFIKINTPEELKGEMSEEEWLESFEETKALMEEMGQNPTVEPAIVGVYSVEGLKLFLAAGDDLSLASPEMKRLLMKLDEKAGFQATPAEYLKYKSPRYGTANPEQMDNL